jgi:hypothetical protein
MYYLFIKNLFQREKPKKKPLLVGFFSWVFWVFLGGFFWVGFLLPTLTQGELAGRQQAPSSQAVSVIQPVPSCPSACVDKQGPITSVHSGPDHPSKPASSSVMPTK